MSRFVILISLRNESSIGVGRARRYPASPAQDSPHPGNKFLQVNRAGQVIVNASIEYSQLTFPILRGTYSDNWSTAEIEQLTAQVEIS
jgi:hypothetical protein